MSGSNVARAASRFVGRETQLGQLCSWLAGDTRLITIVGPPGAGKTRLSRELVVRHAEGFSPPEGGGAWFVDLSDAGSQDDVVEAVASVVGVALTVDEAAGGSFAQLVRAVAARKRMLLVLDNFEQLVELASDIVTRLIEASADLVVLLTSRERLRLDGEQVLSLGALALPSDDAPGPAAAEAAACRLFIDRAARVLPDYAPTEEELERVARLVRALDGLPLPIELAASRMAVLDTKRLLERLEERRLEVLGRAGRDATDRHASLEAAIAWSWELLAEDEQRALCACSTFRGGFDVEAAEALLGAEGLDLVAGLVDKSLVSGAPSERLPGERRLRLLASIRAFAATRLEASEDAATVREAHRRHYARWAESMGARVRRYGRLDELDRLDQERQNLLAATQGAPPEQELALVSALSALLERRGPLRHHEALLDGARARLGAQGAPLANDSGWLLLGLGRLDDASDAFEAAISGGDVGTGAEAGAGLALARSLRREPAAADAALAAARGCAAEHGDRLLRGRVRRAAAEVALARGELEAANVEGAGALADAVDAGSRPDEGAAHLLLARIERARDAGSAASRRSADSALEAYREGGDTRRIAEALSLAAELAADARDLDARSSLEASAAALAEMAADPTVTAAVAVTRAYGALAEGDPERALAALRRARSDARPSARARLLEGLAHSDRGERSEARAALASALEDADGRQDFVATVAACAAAVVAADARTEATLYDRHAEDGSVAAMLLGLVRAHPALAGDDAGVAAAVSAARGEAGLHGRSALVRRFTRWLAAALPADERRRVAMRAVDPNGEALIVARDGSWFRAPGGELVDLSRKKKLMALLRALTDPREAGSEAPVPMERVLAAVWPGEKMLAEAATNRVYATVALLRKAGLRELIASDEDGYRLANTVRVVVLLQ